MMFAAWPTAYVLSITIGASTNNHSNRWNNGRFEWQMMIMNISNAACTYMIVNRDWGVLRASL